MVRELFLTNALIDILSNFHILNRFPSLNLQLVFGIRFRTRVIALANVRLFVDITRHIYNVTRIKVVIRHKPSRVLGR